MSITRVNINSNQDSNEELSNLMKIAKYDDINKNHDLYQEIGLAYYSKKLSEIGNDPVVAIKSHIKNNEFDAHKDKAYWFFNSGDYEAALSSFNNIIRNKYTRIIKRFRIDLEEEFFYILGKSYYSCMLNKAQLLTEEITPEIIAITEVKQASSAKTNDEFILLITNTNDHESSVINNIAEILIEKPADINSNSTEADISEELLTSPEKSEAIVEEKITPEYIDEEINLEVISEEEITPEFISEEETLAEADAKKEIALEDINMEKHDEIQTQVKLYTFTNNANSASKQSSKEEFYKQKKYHLFKFSEQQSTNINIATEKQDTSLIKLDGPLMSKSGKTWSLKTANEKQSSVTFSSDPLFSSIKNGTVKKRKKRDNSNSDEDYVPTRKSKK